MLKSETLPTDSLAHKGKSRDASASKNLHNKKSLPLLSPLLSLKSMGICRRRKFSEKENLIRSCNVRFRSENIFSLSRKSINLTN